MAGRVSIVVPTFNRKEVLAKAVRAYCAQSGVSEIKEVIVVDDGSTDGTDQVVSTLVTELPFPVRKFHQLNRGPASARNIGISQATGEIILFTDDDIIPAPNLIAEHLSWHDQYPEAGTAVLGYVTWAPELRPTPFMNWLGLDGPLFAYGHFLGKAELDFRAFYTCNLSLKRDFLRPTERFDEDFRGAAWEDTEFGYRLQKRGMRLLYNPAAVGYHYQHMTFAAACQRTHRVALAFRILEQKDAGKHLLKLMEAESATLPPRGRLGRLLSPALRALKRGLLSPLGLLLDTQIPLPWSVYRSFTWKQLPRANSSGDEPRRREMK
jgi:glycosyltransferase involved in cell wall biosynthesis